jgi:exopolysaccharide biosynthesis polyprenyl glycosylphosphotransferase
MAIIYYVYPSLGLGRGIVALGFSLGAVTLLLWRVLFLKVSGWPQFLERTVIVGDCLISDALAMELWARPELGIRVVGQLKGFDKSNGSHNAIPREGDGAALVKFVESHGAKRVILAFSERRGKCPVGELLQLKDRGVRIQEGVDLYEAITGKVYIDRLRLSRLLFSPADQSGGHLIIYKRILSILLSGIGLVLFFPLMLLVAVAIRLDSAGPVIFRQKRVGLHGDLFTVYKFRTMADRADQEGNHRPAEIADCRFTRVGRLLRLTHIDELPQLWNILRGDMTFVGPRPFVPNQEKECIKHIPYYSRRWVVRPGATGWAQVNRGYNATIDDNKEKFAYDLFYIKNCSVGLDLLIVFKTFKILLLGRGSR